jgi:hypothetical protein
MIDDFRPVILTADHSWSENNGKIGLSGIFENWSFSEFPAQVMPFSIYLRYGPIQKGPHVLTVDFQKIASTNVIFNIELEYALPAPLNNVQLQFKTPFCILHEQGEYELVFRLDKKVIAKHPISATMK